MKEFLHIDSEGFSHYKSYISKNIVCKKQATNSQDCWRASIYMILSCYIPNDKLWNDLDFIKKKMFNSNAAAEDNDITGILSLSINKFKISCRFINHTPDIQTLLSELESEYPILVLQQPYETTNFIGQHAVVLTSITYKVKGEHLTIVNMEVNDPAPYEDSEETNCKRLWDGSEPLKGISKCWTIRVASPQ